MNSLGSFSAYDMMATEKSEFKRQQVNPYSRLEVQRFGQGREVHGAF